MNKYIHFLFQMQESNGHHLINLTLLDCCYGSPAILVCANSQCQQSAPMCQQESCQCQQKHSSCRKHSISEITNKMLSKLKEKPQILDEKIKFIEQLFDQLIQKLSSGKNRFSTSMQLFGLQPTSIKLLKLVEEQKITEIDGLIISRVIEQLQKNAFFYDDINSQELDRLQYACKHHIKEVEQMLSKYAVCFPLDIQSNIINHDQQKIIKSFIPKKVKDFQLIFRASRDGFQAAKFHQKCDGKKNTLVIVQTKQDKIIGGFTTNRWLSQQNWVSSSDNNSQSFLFSLNSNLKYHLKSNEPAIQNHQKYGPVFGNEDLMIVSDCDKEPSCCTSLGQCFRIDKKQQFKQSLMKFIGNQSPEFFVKDYEVFRVIF